MPTSVNWDTVRQEYETGEFTQSELAEKHSVTQQRISQKAKAGNWVKPDKSLVESCKDLELLQNVDARSLGKRTPGNVAKFIEVFAITGSRKTAANSIGLSENQASRWVKSDPSLVQLMAAKRNSFLSEQVHKIASAKDWQAARYLLSHANETRDQFGDERNDTGPVIVLQISRS